jgi:hypothetical protein
MLVGAEQHNNFFAVAAAKITAQGMNRQKQHANEAYSRQNKHARLKTFIFDAFPSNFPGKSLTNGGVCAVTFDLCEKRRLLTG